VCQDSVVTGLSISLNLFTIHSGPANAYQFDGMLDPIAGRIERYMDLLASRQKLVASNIANIDTPGYKTKDIDFQFEFMSHIDGLGPDVRGVEGLQVKQDGNDVSLDRETRLLTENSMRFNLAQTLLKSQLKMVRSAIEEGKSS
jgi:flagellar basal-body rod protein FlgB